MEIYEAKYDFCDDCGESLLSFNKGEKFLVTNKSDGGWWAAQNLSSNEIGYIPSAYVEVRAVIFLLFFFIYIYESSWNVGVLYQKFWFVWRVN